MPDEVPVPTYLAELAKIGKVRLGSGRLPTGFWTLPRPHDQFEAGVDVLVQERADGR